MLLHTACYKLKSNCSKIVYFIYMFDSELTNGAKIGLKLRLLYSFRQDILNTPDFLGLMIEIWASLGSDFVTFSIFYHILRLIMG